MAESDIANNQIFSDQLAVVHRKLRLVNLHVAQWVEMVTGKFADKPTHGQLSRELVNLRNSQPAEILELTLEYIIAKRVISVDNIICTLTLIDRVRVMLRARFTGTNMCENYRIERSDRIGAHQTASEFHSLPHRTTDVTKTVRKDQLFYSKLCSCSMLINLTVNL